VGVKQPNQLQVLAVDKVIPSHRDKTRVRMPEKNVKSFEINMLAVYGPTLGYDTKQRNSFLIKFGVFFTIKTRF
jgi:hypothetical protein